MSCDVFANTNEISCKKSGHTVLAQFPDVCWSPPSPPAGPIPVPYPDTSFAKDMRNGSKTVKIKGGEIMLKDQSFYKTAPLGDEAATQGLGANVITHVITGKTYFVAWSMDVKVEGLNVCRHLDLTTSNDTSPTYGTGPTQISGGEAAKKYPNQTCPDDERERRHNEYKQTELQLSGDDNCNPGNQKTPKRAKREADRIAAIPCSRINKRIEVLKKAAKQRQDATDACFNKGPDPANPKVYEDHQQVIADHNKAIQHAEAAQKVNCAPGHPMANQ
jgi:hypothetical protein